MEKETSGTIGFRQRFLIERKVWAGSLILKFYSLELTPQPISFIPSFFAPFVLLVDLLDVIGFLCNGCFQP